MAGFVDSVACDLVKGDARSLQSTVELWKVPGSDGFGAHKLGAGDSDFKFTLVKYSDKLGIRSWWTSIQVFKGEIVTIVNDQGNIFESCMITSFTIIDPKRVFRSGAGYSYRAETTIEGVQV